MNSRLLSYLLDVRRFSSEPLGVLCSRVEVLRGFEEFILTVFGSRLRFREQSIDGSFGHRLEILCGIDRLIEDLGLVYPSNDDGCWEIHRIVQTLDRAYHSAFQNHAAAHRLHP